jgi:hypothetical protein
MPGGFKERRFETADPIKTAVGKPPLFDSLRALSIMHR